MRPEWKQACEAGDVERIGALIDAGFDPNARDEHGQTALMNAAKHGHEPVVRLLIDRGADLDHHAKFGFTALMLAIVNMRVSIAEMLIAAGADVSRRGTGAPGFFDKDALALARDRGQDEIVRLLEPAPGG
jgi:uncharacterized protein